CLARREPPSAHGRDPVPEGTGPDAELEATAAEDVERGRGPGEDGGRPQRQAEDVPAKPYPLGASSHIGQQRPGVQERRLVRVVLERDQVEPCPVGGDRQVEHVLWTAGTGGDERAEHQIVTVVRHTNVSSRIGAVVWGSSESSRGSMLKLSRNRLSGS